MTREKNYFFRGAARDGPGVHAQNTKHAVAVFTHRFSSSGVARSGRGGWVHPPTPTSSTLVEGGETSSTLVDRPTTSVPARWGGGPVRTGPPRYGRYPPTSPAVHPRPTPSDDREKKINLNPAAPRGGLAWV